MGGAGAGAGELELLSETATTDPPPPRAEKRGSFSGAGGGASRTGVMPLRSGSGLGRERDGADFPPSRLPDAISGFIGADFGDLVSDADCLAISRQFLCLYLYVPIPRIPLNPQLSKFAVLLRHSQGLSQRLDQTPWIAPLDPRSRFRNRRSTSGTFPESLSGIPPGIPRKVPKSLAWGAAYIVKMVKGRGSDPETLNEAAPRAFRNVRRRMSQNRPSACSVPAGQGLNPRGARFSSGAGRTPAKQDHFPGIRRASHDLPRHHASVCDGIRSPRADTRSHAAAIDLMRLGT